jgi:hypothetical protein
MSPLVHHGRRRDVFCLASRPVEMLRGADTNNNNKRAPRRYKSYDHSPRPIRRSSPFSPEMSADAERLLGLQELWSAIINTFLEMPCKQVDSDSSRWRVRNDTLCVFASRSHSRAKF